MRRFLLSAALALAMVAVAAPPAVAGSPHFVSLTATRTDDSIIVSGKEAGLGNETQVHIEVTATAECINHGAKHPKADNKESVSAEGDFPVQNGEGGVLADSDGQFRTGMQSPDDGHILERDRLGYRARPLEQSRHFLRRSRPGCRRSDRWHPATKRQNPAGAGFRPSG